MQLHFTVFLQLIVNSEVCEGFCLKCSSAELDSSSATNSAMVTPPWLTLSAKINHVPQELICMVNLVFHIVLFLSTCITCFFVWEALELALVCYLATHMPDFLLCIKIGIKEKKEKILHLVTLIIGMRYFPAMTVYNRVCIQSNLVYWCCSITGFAAHVRWRI